MPLMDITNPAIIRFLIENYDKESRLRINWIQQHKEKIQEAATLKREAKNYFETDVIAENMVGGLATITRDHEVAAHNRRKTPVRDGILIPQSGHFRCSHSIPDCSHSIPDCGHSIPDCGHSIPDASFNEPMRPVNPETRGILYKPKPEDGRVQYLKKRTKVNPEERYYFSECSSWDYGWRLKDSEIRQQPEYGRCWHLTGTLNTRVGPQPDPPHYKTADPPGLMKCT